MVYSLVPGWTCSHDLAPDCHYNRDSILVHILGTHLSAGRMGGPYLPVPNSDPYECHALVNELSRGAGDELQVSG